MGLGQLCLLAVNDEVGILSSHRDWAAEALSFLMMTLQRNGFQDLEKDSWSVGEKYIDSSKARGGCYNSQTFLANA